MLGLLSQDLVGVALLRFNEAREAWQSMVSKHVSCSRVEVHSLENNAQTPLEGMPGYSGLNLFWGARSFFFDRNAENVSHMQQAYCND